MRSVKLSILLSKSRETINIERPINPVEGLILVKKVSIFWEYKNVLSGELYVDRVVSGVNQRTSIDRTGYFTIDEIGEMMKDTLDLELSVDRNSAKASVENTGSVASSLSDVLCVILGLDKGSSISAGDTIEGSRTIDLLKGLRYLKIFCSAVDTDKSIDERGYGSQCLVNIPVTTEQTLFGNTQRLVDIESEAQIGTNKLDSLLLKVTDQDENLVDIGRVLIDAYVY